MSLVIRACRPRGVYEGVVQVLLDVVDHPLFELDSVPGEQTNACCSLFHDRLVARPERIGQIL